MERPPSDSPTGDREAYDVAVVGAGPSGLMAALKSALLYHLAVALDKGKRTGRAFWATKMHNIRLPERGGRKAAPQGPAGSDPPRTQA